MVRTKKRARADPELSQSQPQLHAKRQRGPNAMAAQAKEEADDTTAADDVRYMRTQPKAQAPIDSSRAKSFPSQTSEVIDLTLSDELDNVFPAYSSRSKALQDQAEEQRHSKYALQNKMTGTLGERSLGQSSGGQGTEISEGEVRWAIPSLSADDLAQRRQQKKQERKRQRKEAAMDVINAQRSYAPVMFTLSEAVAFLWQPQLAITYDLPTGDYVPCQ
ncbi:uncharacterized protein J4E92_002163 [Alternaria infectoria]|uniref:uncharacterized protein n=1 Tax=Alternaria infectoria TaxID=45303 RepID=UPI00221E767D|nr:uncharacterized protein J4E92_002163 [Alternaria infectoria]KAI4937432.1 hypothetical protein J4E92_002163 [Alternaria infectoria]